MGQADGLPTVRLPAEIDVFSAPAITGALCGALDSGGPGLIIDMSGMDKCDSACLGALVQAARRARGWGSWVRVVVPDPNVRKVFRLVALDEVMPLHASVAEAVAAAGSATVTVTAGGSARIVGRASSWVSGRGPG